MFGDKALLDDNVRQSYSFSGASHVLAVSGLHVGVLMLVFNSFISFFIGGNIFNRRLVRSFLVVTLLWVYVWLTGGSASVCRAAIMFSMLNFAFLFQRPYLVYSSVVASAFLIVVYNPESFFDVGFQLSYAAVLSIVYFQPKIAAIFPVSEVRVGFLKNRYVKKVVSWAWSLTSVSLAAQIGTAPIVLFYFHQFSFVFWLSGLVVVPLVAVVLYAAVAFYLFFWLTPLSSAIAMFLSFVVKVMNASVSFLASLPCAVVDWVSFSLTDCLLAYLVIFAFAAFLSLKNVHSLLLSQIFVCVLLGKSLFFSLLPSEKFVAVYNFPRASVVNMFSGSSNYVYAPVSDSLRITNSLADFWLRKNAGKPSYSSLPVLSVGGKSLFVLDRYFSDFNTNSPVFVDYLVVSNDVRIPFHVFNGKFRCGRIIVDSSCTKATAQWWNACFSNVYIVREQGDFLESWL